MIASERCMYIMKQLTQKSVIDLKGIARELNASESTIRRDIEKLEKLGKLKRVFGGAELANPPDSVVTTVLTMRQKNGFHAQEKAAVAAYAADLVQDGDSVFVDGGTSMAPLLKLLAQRNVRIVTNNCLVLHELTHAEASIVVVGGYYLSHFHMTVGPVAENNLANFHFNHAFLSCPAVNLEEGMSYTSEIETTSIKKIAAAHADHKHLLLDASKLHFRAFCKFMELDQFDTIICNRDAEITEYPTNFVLLDDV